MNITLTPELEKFIKDKVASGQYATAGEVVWYALNLLEQQEKPREQQLEEFNRELQARIDALDRGEYVTSDQFEREWQERSARRRAELRSGERHPDH
jgi:antitoxin ParD1/3/4